MNPSYIYKYNQSAAFLNNDKHTRETTFFFMPNHYITIIKKPSNRQYTFNLVSSPLHFTSQRSKKNPFKRVHSVNLTQRPTSEELIPEPSLHLQQAAVKFFPSKCASSPHHPITHTKRPHPGGVPLRYPNTWIVDYFFLPPQKLFVAILPTYPQRRWKHWKYPLVSKLCSNHKRILQEDLDHEQKRKGLAYCSFKSRVPIVPNSIELNFVENRYGLLFSLVFFPFLRLIL